MSMHVLRESPMPSNPVAPAVQRKPGARAELRGKTFDEQVQMLSPEGAGSAPPAEVGGESATDGAGAGDKKKDKPRTKAKAEGTLGTDITPATVKDWEKIANGELATVKKAIAQKAREALGSSAPNRIELGVKLSAAGDLGGVEKQKGKDLEVSGPKVGAEATFKGELGWGLTLADCMILAGEDPSALEIDKEFSFAGESGRVKASPIGELFVGAKVEAKASLNSADMIGEVFGKFASLAGQKGAEAAQATGKKATGDVKSAAESSSDPVPKIGKKGAGESGPKADAQSGDVALAEGGISGKAFAGAEITVGGKGALTWNKKKPEQYASTIEHYTTLALGLNPVTMPFAPAAIATFKLFPDVSKEIAPTLMGEAGKADVAAVEATVTGTAGASAKGALEAKFANGKVSFKASGEGAVGFGGGADVKVEADALEVVRMGAAVQGGFLAELTGALSDKTKELADRASVVWDEIVEAIASNASRLKTFLAKCGDKALDVLMLIWDKLVAAGMSVKDLIASAWESATSGVAAASKILAKAGADAIAPLWAEVKGSTADMVAFAEAVLADAKANLSTLLALLWKEDWSVLGAVWGSSGTKLQAELFDFIKGKGWSAVGSLLANASGGVSALIKRLWDACRMENLVDVFSNAAGRWQELLDHVWSNSSWEQLVRMVGAAGGNQLVALAKGIYQKAGYWDMLNHFGRSVLSLI